MRNILSLLLVVVVLAFAMPAFAEKIVPPGPSTSQYDAAPLPPSVHKTVANKSGAVKAVKTNLATKKDIKGLSSRIKGLEGQTGRLATETKANSEAVSNMADNMNGLANAMGNTTAATRNLSGRVSNVEKNLVAEAKNLGDQSYVNTLFLGIGGLIALAIMTIIIVVVVVCRTRKNNANLQPLENRLEAAIRSIEDTRDAVDAGFAAVQTGITELPQRTADAVKAFDPRPIDVTVAGLHAVLTLSDEAKGLGVYEYIDVEKGIDPGFKPEDYPLPTTSDRNYAFDKTRQAIRQLGNGSLKRMSDDGDSIAAAKILLIEYHRDVTKQLVVATA